MKKQILFLLLVIYPFFNFASSLESTIATLEEETSSRIGVSVWDTHSNERWDYRGYERFPILGTAKVFVCAAMLDAIERKTLNKDATITIKPEELSSYSPATQHWVEKPIDLTTLCEAATLEGDNTAANVIMRELGGPQTTVLFLRSIKDTKTYLTEYFPTDSSLRGNSSTPNTMVLNLRNILEGDKLNYGAREQLKTWMKNIKRSKSKVFPTIPEGWSIAERRGFARDSRAELFVIWREGYQPVYVGIYIKDYDLSIQASEQLLTQVAQLILREYHEM
ncbi:class A beta-lactamase [Vibrio sagamiensis]|uniref:beta-lactamase n=1 Tax=Vibrio sagamiensis NBRC 104589 TaxID=1219064 RepID=A0A511QGZ5_9VIBR|nr:class A beta-lactamase [Vibrio sagamiensis]PNQ56759.1 class A beta-lactamase [Vibrio agarivorans]GEM76584.1 beta-lactamase [Vibrio sagamiensis NBRC 104589]